MKPRGFLLSLLLILIFISCSGDPGAQDTAVPVTVSVYEADEAKTIGYDGSVSGVSGKIDSISVSVYGQDSPGTAIAGPVSIPYSGGTEDISIGNLIPDGYTITAEGYSGTHKLTSDSWTGWISRDTSAVSIEMKTFSGKGGGISVTPDFPEGTSGSWALSWKLMGGEAFGTEAYSGSVSAAYTAGSGVSVELSASADGFDAGRYILMMDAASGSETLSAAEAVRLLPGLDSSGTISFGREVSGIGEEAILTVSDNTGRVIPVEDGGYSVTGDSATLTLSGLSAEPTDVLVYDNGDALSGFTESYTGGTLTIGLSGLSSGVHDVTAIVLDGTASGIGSVRIALRVNNPTIVLAGQYGVAWDYSDPDSSLYRLYPTEADADVAASQGIKAMADPNGIVSSGIMIEPIAATASEAGDSPFDNVAPWHFVTLVSMEPNGRIHDKISEDESITSFISANSSEDLDIMVSLPDMYYLVIDDPINEIRYYYVSGTDHDGFTLHPASESYVSRYMGYNDGKGIRSRSGVQHGGSYSLEMMHGEAADRGEGYGQYDWAIHSYLQLLYLVEYADFDSQKKIGQGSPERDALTGITDGMQYHTGTIAASASDPGTVQYRYIEDIWDLAYYTVPDGILMMNGQLYVSSEFESYAEETVSNGHVIAAYPKELFISADSPYIPIGTPLASEISGNISRLEAVEGEASWSIGIMAAADGVLNEDYVADFGSRAVSAEDDRAYVVRIGHLLSNNTDVSGLFGFYANGIGSDVSGHAIRSPRLVYKEK